MMSSLSRVPAAFHPVFRVLVVSVRHKHHRRTHLYPGMNKREAGLCAKSFPYLHGKTDDVSIDVIGVSNKQFPVMLTWERPEHIHRWKPHPEGSGDSEIYPTLPKEMPKVGLSDLKSFQEAPDVVKKILSMEYADQREIYSKVREDLRKRVEEHQMDSGSLVVLIARLTAKIRLLQSRILEQQAKGIDRAGLRHVCKIKVDQRRAYIRRLRAYDYKKYEWLLEKLNLVFKERPFSWEMIQRNRHLDRLTELWCEEFKQYKLDQLKSELESQQPEYLRNKAETLRWMKKEEEELGMDRTVRDEDIEDCLKKANEIEERLASTKNEDSKKYFIYEPEATKNDEVYLP